MNGVNLNRNPWYRTRSFWGTVFSLMLAWSVFFYFSTFPQETFLNNLLQHILNASGGFIFLQAGNVVSTVYGIYISLISYSLFVGATLYFTFKRTEVQLTCPVIFTLQFISANLLIMSIIAGLN